MEKFLLTFDLEPDFGKTGNYIAMQRLPDMIDYLYDRDIKATFFVTADVVEKYPDILKELSEKHEVGCQGYRHEDLNKKSKSAIAEELIKAGDVFQDELGLYPKGFRSPNSYMDESILNVLEKLGYEYDSSIIPGIVPWKYSNIGAKKEPHWISEDIVELPISRLGPFPMGTTWLQFIGYKPFNSLFKSSKPKFPIMYAHLAEFGRNYNSIDNLRRVFYYRRGETAREMFDKFIEDVREDYELVYCIDLVDEIKDYVTGRR